VPVDEWGNINQHYDNDLNDLHGTPFALVTAIVTVSYETTVDLSRPLLTVGRVYF